ncbi:glycosyltransferase family 4 protein [Salipaludibacillus sp. HK11]|uniref:glycosyltransferase family 4 protein n=1 Tax=Salipaludibacillus sp. HK11 TaxID=3394320 RepID=UPI0039FBF3A3
MSKKILFCATVDYHFQAFHLPQMQWFKEQGWEVHVASSGEMELNYTDKKYKLSIDRSPFRFTNINAYKELKEIIASNNYSIIHCHTPLGGVISRLAARKSRGENGAKVMYTAHGFHFSKDSPISNWLLYYPVEFLLTFHTDLLITINEEDFNFANSRLPAKEIKHIHGVGIDIAKYKAVDEKKKIEGRKSLGYNPDDFLLFYGAEFNKNKNQKLLIKVMKYVKKKNLNVKLLLAGPGSYERCAKLAKEIDVDDCINFLGLRNDIDTILPLCDVAVGSSFREGLPVNIMEAMSCQLPIIATENRGHTELIVNDYNGWIVKQQDIEYFAEKIIYLSHNKNLKEKLGLAGREIIEKKYSLNHVLRQQTQIYSKYMGEEGVVSWATQ